MSIDSIIHAAQLKMSDGHSDEAFVLLNKAKSLKIPRRNLDVERARCFLIMNQRAAAQQALLEELSFFPDNTEASSLLKQIESPQPRVFSDREFNSILDTVESYTMLSQERLYSLYTLSREICKQDVKGEFVECGVARGGSSALLAYVIKKYSKSRRLLYSCDSFSGMPEPTAADTSYGQPADETGWGTGTCAAPIESLLHVCDALGVSEIVKPVKGYFEETLPLVKKEIQNIAFLHIDGDWYESTKTILANFYEAVSSGGVIQVDDYGHWAGCKKAFHEFERQVNITLTTHQIDATGIWLRKE